MADFLTLKFLVTPYLIIFVYWIVAFVLPLVALAVMLWLSYWLIPRLKVWVEPIVSDSGVLEIEEVRDVTTTLREFLQKYRWVRWLFWLGVAVLVLIFELVWRLICEFLIVYYNIHDALMGMAAASGS